MGNIEIFRSYSLTIAHFFPPSANVDFLLFSVGIKPVVRIFLNQENLELGKIQSWCKNQELFHFIDKEGCFFLSRSKKKLEIVLQLDHSPMGHELELGRHLGYPLCCCEQIARVGEKNIDAYEASLQKEKFQGEFYLIDPHTYKQGCAFISHVPCSYICKPSLLIAQYVVRFILEDEKTFQLDPWRKKLTQIDSIL